MNRAMKSFQHSIASWRDKYVIVILSFVDSVCKFDLSEIFKPTNLSSKSNLFLQI